MALYYIISTKLFECREKFYETGWFDSLYTGQPDSRPVIESDMKDYPNFRFLFFDRVNEADNPNYSCLTGLYRLLTLKLNEQISTPKRCEHSLRLELIRKFERPILFKPETDLWESLETTRNKKLPKFYNARRILLPLPKFDFLRICVH